MGSLSTSLTNFRGDLIQSLIRNGHHVTAAAPDMNEKTAEVLSGYGVDCLEISLSRNGLNPIKDLLNLIKLSQIMRKISPDILLTYTIKPNTWGAIAARFADVTSISMITGLGYAFTDGKQLSITSSIVRTFARRLYAFSTSLNKYVIFQNLDDRDDFIKFGCLLDPSKARIVDGSGVNMEHYKRTPLPDNAVFLMVSRLIKNKGVREYAQASMILKKKYPHAKFLLIGYFDGGPDSISEKTVDEWVVGGLEFLGRKNDIRPYMDQASVYVLPSYREGTPRSSLEAMSMGRPVITTDVPGCRGTVKNEKTGFLVPVRDVRVLAKKMEQLILDKKLRNQLGGKSYEYCKEKYEVSIVNNAIQGIIFSNT